MNLGSPWNDIVVQCFVHCMRTMALTEASLLLGDAIDLLTAMRK